MNTLHLKYIVEIDRTGSITKAAENLYMGQPNLSKAVRELEDNLGVEIFRRTARGVTPTEKGAKILRYAKNILSQVERMEYLCTADDRAGKTFNFSASCAGYITGAFKSFCIRIKNLKKCDVNFYTKNSVETLDMLVKDKITLGIIICREGHEEEYIDVASGENIVFDELWKYRCRIIMGKKNPLSVKKTISHDDLDGFTEIRSLCGFLSLESESRVDKTGKSRICSDNLESLLSIVAAGKYNYMISSPISEEWAEKHNLIQIPFESNEIYKDCLIYKKNHRFSDLEKFFLEELMVEKSKIENSDM